MPGIAQQEVYYTGVFDCMRKMIKSEGLFAIYKGIVPPIVMETPRKGIMLLVFEQYKRLFTFGNDKPGPLTYALAGFSVGVLDALLTNPFEMVKVTLQANRSTMKEVPSTWSVTKQISRESGLGLNGLNKGLPATILRNSVFTTIYFGFYHSVKDALPSYQDPVKEFFRKFTIGLIGGSIGSVVNIPFDVAKSRIQGPQPVKGVVKYSTTMGSIATVYKEEGFAALYKGLTPKMMRLGPGGAIILVVFDYVYEFLNLTFK